MAERSFNMKKSNKASLRRLKIGTYSIAFTAVVIALVVFVNLVVSSLPVDVIHTNTKDINYAEIGEVSETIINSLTGDVTLYLITENDEEDVRLRELLSMYEAKSPKIRVEVIDPVEEPAFTSVYTDDKVDANSIIAVSEKRSKVVPYSDIYSEYYYLADGTSLSYEQYQYAQYYGYETYYDALFEGEMAITSALEYVNSESLPTVYVLQGHDESVFDETYSAYLKVDNITVSELKLDTESGVPEDCELLCIIMPTRDITSSELDCLSDYSNQGGDILFITDYRFTAEELPNFASLAKNSGLEAVEGVVTDTSNAITQNGTQFVATVVESENGITAGLDTSSLKFVATPGHGIKEIEASGATVTPLVTTSTKANLANVTDEGKLEENEDYKSGSEIIIGAVSERATVGGERDDVSSFVWYSNSAVINSEVYQYYGTYGNVLVFLSTVNNYCDKSTSVSIIGKTIMVEPVQLTGGEANFWMTVMTVILPISVLGAGFFVWFRRRRR